MTQIEALRRLTALGVPGFGTRDAAAALKVEPANAHMILRRLERQGFISHLVRGRWAAQRDVEPLLLPEMLSAPSPAYVSLHTALFHHGLVEQIPAVIYAVTTGRPRVARTGSGTVSLHRMPAALFRGFELSTDGAKIATAEKALFDTLYLGSGKSRLFASLPEVSVPRSFSWRAVRGYLESIKSPIRRSYVARRIDALS